MEIWLQLLFSNFEVRFFWGGRKTKDLVVYVKLNWGSLTSVRDQSGSKLTSTLFAGLPHARNRSLDWDLFCGGSSARLPSTSHAHKTDSSWDNCLCSVTDRVLVRWDKECFSFVIWFQCRKLLVVKTDAICFFLNQSNALASSLSVKATKELLKERRKEMKLPFNSKLYFCEWWNSSWNQWKWSCLPNKVSKYVKSHFRWLTSLKSVAMSTGCF